MPPEDQVNIAVPVLAEDFQRRRRRIIAICCAAAVVLVIGVYFVYRHYMDPVYAREALDDARHLVSITRYGQAILASGRAIALKPDYADAYMLRAQAYAAQRELDQAESDYARLIQLESNAPRAYAGRCEVRYNAKDYAGAISDCTKAIGLDPTNARSFNLRGAALRESNQPTQSLADMNRAVELAPNVDNLYQRGATLRALKKYQEAIADFDQAAYLFPSNPELYRARAETKRAMGDETGAQEDYQKGKKIEGLR